jgi:hypothetical protein
VARCGNKLYSVYDGESAYVVGEVLQLIILASSFPTTPRLFSLTIQCDQLHYRQFGHLT